jgi:hypothetical protein
MRSSKLPTKAAEIAAAFHKNVPPFARTLISAIKEARMGNTVEVTIPVDVETARALESPARREAGGRYLSGLLKGGRVRDVLAEAIAEAKREARAWPHRRRDRR